MNILLMVSESERYQTKEIKIRKSSNDILLSNSLKTEPFEVIGLRKFIHKKSLSNSSDNLDKINSVKPDKV